jgi:DNA repair exonuclease SbcCD ATPase subunit
VKSGELADRLLVSDSLIRKWSDKYAQFLSPQAGLAEPGQIREFNEADQLVMASIAHLRDNGKGHEEIIDELGRGWRVETLPPIPDDEVEQAKSKIALVPVDRLHRALDRIEVLQGDLQRLQRERDQALEASKQSELERRQSEQRIADLREELGAVKSQVGMLTQRSTELKEELLKAQAAGTIDGDLMQQLGQLQGDNYRLQEQLRDRQNYINYLIQQLENEKQRKRGLFGR